MARRRRGAKPGGKPGDCSPKFSKTLSVVRYNIKLQSFCPSRKYELVSLLVQKKIWALRKVRVYEDVLRCRKSAGATFCLSLTTFAKIFRRHKVHFHQARKRPARLARFVQRQVVPVFFQMMSWKSSFSTSLKDSIKGLNIFKRRVTAKATFERVIFTISTKCHLPRYAQNRLIMLRRVEPANLSENIFCSATIGRFRNVSFKCILKQEYICVGIKNL